ncbi:hypothetical protein, partial [Denitromonas halophila]|uniref:hypothetical protein n=1 Tax=Denitromonas halophila TaxID=1629404 RepID=UPI001C92973F
SGAAKPSRCNVELEVHITKKPTRRDLLCVITELQALIGEARATHGNDRNPHGYEQGQRLLKRAEDLCIQARGFDSPTDMPSND